MGVFVFRNHPTSEKLYFTFQSSVCKTMSLSELGHDGVRPKSFPGTSWPQGTKLITKVLDIGYKEEYIILEIAICICVWSRSTLGEKVILYQIDAVF